MRKPREAIDGLGRRVVKKPGMDRGGARGPDIIGAITKVSRANH